MSRPSFTLHSPKCYSWRNTIARSTFLLIYLFFMIDWSSSWDFWNGHLHSHSQKRQMHVIWIWHQNNRLKVLAYEYSTCLTKMKWTQLLWKQKWFCSWVMTIMSSVSQSEMQLRINKDVDVENMNWPQMYTTWAEIYYTMHDFDKLFQTKNTRS